MATTVEQLLNEAHATEQALITTLQAHLAMTPPGPHRQLLDRHLTETRRHARAIGDRLRELDLSGNRLTRVGLSILSALRGQRPVQVEVAGNVQSAPAGDAPQRPFQAGSWRSSIDFGSLSSVSFVLS